MWIIVLLMLLLSIFLLMLFTVELEFKLYIDNKKNGLFIIIRWLKGFIKLRYNISLEISKQWYIKMRQTDKKLINVETFWGLFPKLRHWFSTAQNMKDIIVYVMRAVTMPYISIRMDFGFFDAAITAILVGGIISLLYMGINAYGSRLRLKDACIDIKPDYTSDRIVLDVNGIIRIKMGHIIIAAIKVFKIRILDEVKAVVMNGRTASHTRYNENHDGEY